MATLYAETHPLRLLASAVVGRSVSITYLLQPDALGYTNGERIFLPNHDRIDDLRLELLVQASLVCGGALAHGPVRSLLGRSELHPRYLVLEVERCCQLIQDRLPSAFIERLAPLRTGCESGSPDESLAIARSARALPAPPVWFGTLKPWQVLRQSPPSAGQPLDSRTLAQLEARLKQSEPEEEPDEDRLTKNPFWRLLSSPRGKDGFFSRFMRDIFDMTSSPEREGTDSGAAGSSDRVTARMANRLRDITQAIRAGAVQAVPSAFFEGEAGAHSYPEWDHAADRYRQNWVNVEETDARAEDPWFPAGMLAVGGDRPFQRALAGLCLGLERHRNQPQGDDLVLDRMIRLAVDLRLGHSGDERVYAAKLRTRRDLGVEILVDVSSSTLERSAAGMRIFDLHAQTAWKLCRAFSVLGDRVSMHAFNSWGRTLVRFQILKGFDEPLGVQLERRLRHVSVAGYTRCGAAIRHASTLLDRHAGTPYRLLILITDGYPYDDQYEGDYAIEDTRKAIEEARVKGIACVCLSVGSDAEAKRLERVYGVANYLAIPRTEQLAPRLRRLVASAVGQAAKPV